ncbi:MAG: hypothetical protein KatS3mg102_1627 [Planctomycetota bacterium]|nr:MAG: hypothetical protein KatS3mg102_1627 [Planctomycetota bacterium]
MSAAWPSPSWRPRRRLAHRYRFESTRAREELEAQAELYFRALGYRRRADESGRVVFTRGRPWGSLWSPRLRECQTRLELELAEAPPAGASGASPPAGERRAVTIVHQVEVFGRWVLPADEALLEAEARGFERFASGLDVALDKLVRAARRRRRAQCWRRLWWLAGAAGLAGLLAWWWLA